MPRNRRLAAGASARAHEGAADAGHAVAHADVAHGGVAHGGVAHGGAARQGAARYREAVAQGAEARGETGLRLAATVAPSGLRAGWREMVRAHFATWWPVWIAYGASRLGVLVVGYLSQYAAGSRGLAHVGFATSGQFVHYADVVAHGYTLQNATEYPLLPSLMWGAAQLGLPLAAGALLVANVAFLVGLLAFAVLGARYVGVDAARRGALYLAIFPTAHVFSLASTESLMLAGVAGAALLALRGTARGWLLAGLVAALCALTRPPAAFVALPLLGIALTQLRAGTLRGPRLAAALAAGAAVPLAVGGFFLYLHNQTGDALASLHAQARYDRALTLLGPLHAVTGGLRDVAHGTLGPGFELAAAAGIVVALYWFARRAAQGRLELGGWIAFGAASVLLPLATGIAWQMPRFALVVPPVFWMLGVLGSRRTWIHHAALVLLPMALAFKLVFDVVGVTQ